jgi:two-component system response regulator HydG
MPDLSDLTPEEAERVLLELAGGITPDAVIKELTATDGLPTDELYKTLLEQIPAVTFMTSFEPNQQNVYVSPQIESVLGYTPKEWLAKPSLWQERLHPDDKDRFQEEFSKTVMTRGTSVRSVYRFLHKDGHTVWVLGDVRIRRERKTGFPLFVQAVGFDVTELERAKEELRQSKEREIAQQRQRIARLQSEVSREFGPDAIIGSSEAMQKLRQLVAKVASSDTTVLVTGESGTGKEMVARALHNGGPRFSKEMIDLNCAAIPESLLESELFGAEGGRITGVEEHAGKFEQAHGSTLLLDEIGEMAPAMQPKLLRVLEDGSVRRLGGDKKIRVDARVICATSRNLEEAIEKGTFRADLYYRVNQVRITVPPLREHMEDLPELAEHFLAQANRASKRHVRISDEAMSCLKSCSWPGNVRQLKYAIKGAVVICEGDEIRPQHLPPAVAGPRPEPKSQSARLKYYEAIEELERRLILQALTESKGIKAEAARQLSLSTNTLSNRMTYFGISALQEPPWVKCS